MTISVAQFNEQSLRVASSDLLNWLSEIADSLSDNARLVGVAEVAGERIVSAEAGSVVSAADGVVVLAKPGSHVVAWSGARVFAGHGATVVLGSGSSCHVDGESTVEADGSTGLEFASQENTTIVSATGGARVDATECDVYAGDITLVVRHAVTAALLGTATVTQEDARGSSIRRGVVDFDVVLDAMRESAALCTRTAVRAVWPAYPRDGESAELWLEPVRELCREARVTLGLDALAWLPSGKQALVVSEMCAAMALPPTIRVHQLPL